MLHRYWTVNRINPHPRMRLKLPALRCTAPTGEGAGGAAVRRHVPLSLLDKNVYVAPSVYLERREGGRADMVHRVHTTKYDNMQSVLDDLVRPHNHTMHLSLCGH